MAATPEPHDGTPTPAGWQGAGRAGLIVAVGVGTLAPVSWFSGLGIGDPALHFLVFAGLALGWRLVAPSLWRPLVGAGLLGALALATEIVQILLPMRSFAWGEVGYDCLGIGVGLAVGAVGVRLPAFLRNLAAADRFSRPGRARRKHLAAGCGDG